MDWKFVLEITIGVLIAFIVRDIFLTIIMSFLKNEQKDAQKALEILGDY